jgi:thiol-disulfide isomerase/thioredoxin
VAVATLLLVAWLAAVPAAHAAEASRFVPWMDGPPAPVVLSDITGRPATMADYRGKVVLVSFWATWCEFCREQMLAMQALKERLAGAPFEILAVNFAESPARVRDYAKTLPIDFRVVLDPNQDGAKAWRVRILPVSFLVGPDGQPRYSLIGVYDWASDEAVETVRRLLP